MLPSSGSLLARWPLTPSYPFAQALCDDGGGRKTVKAQLSSAASARAFFDEGTSLRVGPGLANWRLTELRCWACLRKMSDIETAMGNYLKVRLGLGSGLAPPDTPQTTTTSATRTTPHPPHSRS